MADLKKVDLEEFQKRIQTLVDDGVSVLKRVAEDASRTIEEHKAARGNSLIDELVTRSREAFIAEFVVQDGYNTEGLEFRGACLELPGSNLRIGLWGLPQYHPPEPKRLPAGRYRALVFLVPIS